MKIFQITENDANTRLDKFLRKLFPNATRSLVYKLNRKEKVKIKSSNSPLSAIADIPPHGGRENLEKFKKKDNEYKLQIGDEVKIFLSDEEFEKLAITPPADFVSFPPHGGGLNENLPQGGGKICVANWGEFSPLSVERGLGGEFKKDIVFEDGDLLVLNKNAGINVHPGDHKTREISLIQQVQDYLGNKYDSLTFKPSLVHRIDRDTSGILLVAKKKNILQKLVNDFKTHDKIKKIYYAIVLGKLPNKEGVIDKKLQRIENAKNENKVQISPNGQTAITHYKVLNEVNLKTKEGNLVFSELEIEIKTGRMHQIRVHLASIGNPILGDKIYGDKKLNAFLEKNYGLNRQALHAWKIEFLHYGRGKMMKLEAKIKDDLKKFVENVKKNLA